MATGNHKLLRVSAGVSHYADVTVDVGPAEAASVLVQDGAFAWLKDEHGPDAYEWTECAEYRAGAVAGVRYALSHLASPSGLWRVIVTRIHAHPAHSTYGSVALAACHATWNALGESGVDPPELVGGRIRDRWFLEYCDRLENASVLEPHVPGVRYACPCCTYLTLSERGAFEICPVCFWEDDGQDDHDADVVRGGPNARLSLTQARTNFRAFRACDERSREHVRDPRPCELPE
jgi:hypothetical protein